MVHKVYRNDLEMPDDRLQTIMDLLCRVINGVVEIRYFKRELIADSNPPCFASHSHPHLSSPTAINMTYSEIKYIEVWTTVTRIEMIKKRDRWDNDSNTMLHFISPEALAVLQPYFQHMEQSHLDPMMQKSYYRFVFCIPTADQDKFEHALYNYDYTLFEQQFNDEVEDILGE